MSESDLNSRLLFAKTCLNEGRVNDAIAACTQLLAAYPRQPDALDLLARLALTLGRADAALPFAQTLLEIQPQQAEAWTLHASILRSLGRPAEALDSARHAIKLNDTIDEAWHIAGIALLQTRRTVEAVEHLSTAIEKFPANASLHACLALALAAEGKIPQALQQATTAEKISSDNPDTIMAMITTLGAMNDYEQVISRCRAALPRHPQLNKALSHSLAVALLVTGRFAEGYAAMYASRIGHDQAASHPYWQGTTSPTQHIVLYGEQGFGDIFQFVRFLPRVQSLVGQVTLRIPAQLERLMRSSMPDIPLSVYHPPATDTRRSAKNAPPDPLLDFPADTDARASLLSLPHLLKLDARTDAQKIPYLRPAAALVEQWAARLVPIKSPRIGIVWAGSPQNGNDHNRSMSLDDLRPLIAKFAPHLVSLQVGREAAAFAAGLQTPSAPITDFADTAAILATLDLLITVDTSIAHLSAAMGRPTWIMLPRDPDWRWLTNREDSPWYPDARLFRQLQPRQWPDVIEKVSARLAELFAL